VDVIHAQFAGPAGAGAYLWHRLTGRPYTVRAHAYDIYRPYRWAGVVLRGAAAVLAISDHAARHIRSTWGVEARVVRVGVSPDAVAIRDRTSPSRPFRVISVGALEPKKGHDLLIRAVGQLIRNGVAVTLDIHGEGSMRRELTNLAEGLPVHLLGWQDPLELRSCLGQYDVFALGARVAPDGDTDGIPVVLMEASLAGLPVVTTNVGGIPELIEHDVTGWARSPTVGDLADGIAMALSDYPAALDRASLATQRVRERHDRDGQAGRLLETWAALVEHRS
jgi:glycosyltransferase involved in cell wall biosynthesis